MKVYRICSKEEINEIFLNTSFLSIGNKFTENKSKNSFDYLPETLYMHFFKNLESILFLDTNSNRCICVYNIPDDILYAHLGYGKYLDFISFKNLLKIEEFAIPSNIIKFDYLEKVDLLASGIDYEEYLSEDFKSFTKQLYKK